MTSVRRVVQWLAHRPDTGKHHRAGNCALTVARIAAGHHWVAPVVSLDERRARRDLLEDEPTLYHLTRIGQRDTARWAA